MPPLSVQQLEQPETPVGVWKDPRRTKLGTAWLARVSPAWFAFHAGGGQDGSWIPGEHLLLLSKLLSDLAAGRITRLIVSMPPRHGKSWMVSRAFVPWFLGLKRDAKVILVSYSESLAVDNSRMAREAVREHGPQVFGISAPARGDSGWRTHDAETGAQLGSLVLAAGVGTGIQGKGADLIAIDDPLRGVEAAMSAGQREKLWQYWDADLIPRLNREDGRVLIVTTRWHADDLVGRLMKADAAGTGEGWTVLNLPALATVGGVDALGRGIDEPLWPEVHSQQALERIRQKRGAWVWWALYQGQPRPIGGGLFKRRWVRWARWIMPRRSLTFRQHEGGRWTRWDVSELTAWATVDLALTEDETEKADATVVAVWLQHPLDPQRRIVLAHVYRERVEGPEIVPLLKRATREWRLSCLWVESVQFQKLIVQEARREGLPVRGWRPRGDKVARALPATGAVEAGEVVVMADQPWGEAFVSELEDFPKGKHDDQVDTLSCAVDVRDAAAGEGLEQDTYGGAGSSRELDEDLRPAGYAARARARELAKRQLAEVMAAAAEPDEVAPPELASGPG